MLKAQINNLMTPFKDVLIQIFGQDGVDALLEISTSDELAAWLNNTVDHDSLIFTKMAALNSNPEHKDTLIKFINFILQSVNPVNQYVKYTTILELLKLLPEQEIVKNLFKTRGKKGEEYRLIEYPNIALEINFFDENDLAIIFIKNLIKQDKIKKKSTHFLGLKNPETIFNYRLNKSRSFGDETRGPVSDGMLEDMALTCFLEKLNSYMPSPNFLHEFNIIKQAFNNIDNLSSAGTKAAACFDYYLKHDFVIIPSGWSDHSMTVAATDKYLIVANRGIGMHPNGGCVIYELKQALTQNDINVLTLQKSQDSIDKLIDSIVAKTEDNTPILLQTLPLTSQKYGTCAIANKKAVVAGVILLLSAEKKGEVEVMINNGSVILDAKNEYKAFTSHTRTLELNELINDLTTTSDPLVIDILLDLLKTYCAQHLEFKQDAIVEKNLQIELKKMSEPLWKMFLNKLTIREEIIVQYLRDEVADQNIPEYIKIPINLENKLSNEQFIALRKYLQEKYPDNFIRFVSKIHPDSFLKTAARYNDLEYINDLILQGEKVSYAVLGQAIKYNNYEALQLMINSDSSLLFDGALNLAISHKKPDIVLNLLKIIMNSEPPPRQELKNNYLCLAAQSSIEAVRYVLALNSEINYPNSRGEFPLISAIRANNSEVVKFLIFNGADVNAFKGNASPLSIALECLNENGADILQLLVENVAKEAKRMISLSKRRNKSPSSPPFTEPRKVALLDCAIRINAVDYVDILLKDTKLHFYALESAFHQRRKEIVINIINEINDNLRYKFYPLVISSIPSYYNDNNDIVIALLRTSNNMPFSLLKEIMYGAIVSKKSDIVAAIIKYHLPNLLSEPEYLFELIKTAENLNAIEIFKLFMDILPESAENAVLLQEMLLMAIKYRNTEIVSMLLEKGALIDNHDPDLSKYLIDAIENNNGSSRVAMSIASCMEQSVIDQPDENNSTPLQFAAQNGLLDVVKILISRGANIQHINNFGKNALIYAVENDALDIATLLLAQGADPNVEALYGETALTEVDNVEILEKLIAHGADIHHVGKNDMTAIKSALRRQSMLVVNKLIQHSDPDGLFKELSDPRVIHFVKRLSDPSRASFLTELSARLTPIQLATLNFEPSQQAAAASSRMSGP